MRRAEQIGFAVVPSQCGPEHPWRLVIDAYVGDERIERQIFDLSEAELGDLQKSCWSATEAGDYPLNCADCWHLWSLHSPSGCGARTYLSSSLNGDPCPCTCIPLADITGFDPSTLWRTDGDTS